MDAVPTQPLSCRSDAAVGRAAFTLTELLVVMAVMGTVAALTLVAARRIAADMRLALGTNTVVAALGEARTLAMKKHKDILVAFMARLAPSGRDQIIQVVVAEWTGDSFLNVNGPRDDAVDRFLPVPGVATRALPAGVSVASPYYHRTQTHEDDIWRPMTYLPWVNPETGEGELIGQPPGVMFSPDGSRILRNSHSDSARSWIDFNDDKLIRLDGTDHDPETILLNWSDEFTQRFPDDETFISLAPFLAIYDFDDVRDRKALDWSEPGNAEIELVGPEGYITSFGNRIHFNRYSGIVMR